MACKVGIVDDAPFVREVIRRIVVGQGHEVVFEANDGQEAIDFVLRKELSQEVDIIFMDMIMPKVNGVLATKTILEFKPKIQIVACSTSAHETMIQKAMEAGCCDYIAKPFSTEDILRVFKPTKQKEIAS